MKLNIIATRPGRLALPFAFALALGGPATSQEGGIEVFAAGTLFSRGTRVSLSHIYKRKGTEFHEHRFVAAVDHGLRPDLTVSALIPYVDKELESDAGDSNSSGLGDVALLAKFRVHKRDWTRSSFNVSAIGGVELPTGATHERDDGARLPTELQPGLGSWNPFLGLATNVSLDRLRFDGLAFYKLNTEGAQDYEKGNFFALEVAAAYRFLHTKYPGPTASAKLGLQWRHEDHAEQDGATVGDSGSDELRLRPGLTWHPAPNMDITLAVEIPIYQDFNGDQLGTDYRTILAIGVRF